MIELNMEQNEGRLNYFFFLYARINMLLFLFIRHNIIELIETEKEYVKDLALIVEVNETKILFIFYCVLIRVIRMFSKMIKN
jgi:hypothetical protein